MTTSTGRNDQNTNEYTVMIFPEDDVWVAFVPTLDIATQGDTREHAIVMAREAIELWIDVARERGEEIPVEQGAASLHQIAVAV